MERENYEGRYSYESSSNVRRTHRHRKYKKISRLTVLIAMMLVLTVVIGGSIAYLATKTAPVKNTFYPSHVTVAVTENFNGSVKSNVNVTNTGDVDAYLRVKLVSYRVNDQGQTIGGEAEVPSFAPGQGWVYRDGYYYYTQPVAPNTQPGSALVGSMTLTGSYHDADGGKQAVEVMAEGVQAGGVNENNQKAVVAAWGIDPATLG